MKPGARAATTTALLGTLVLVVTGFLLKDHAVERWYLWKLESKDEAVREYAAGKLAEMGSRRAIPRLVELFRQDPFSETEILSANGGLGQWTVKADKLTIKLPSHSGTALMRIGAPAAPAVRELLADADDNIRGASTMVSDRIFNPPQEAVDYDLIRSCVTDSVPTSRSTPRTRWSWSSPSAPP